jgi:hypothetical protein
MKFLREGALSAFVILTLLSGGRALATSVTYTETATISGSLDGTTLTNDLLTLTGTGDTADITGGYVLPLTLTFSLSSGESGTFTDNTQVASNYSSYSAGFGDNANDVGILFTANLSAFGYPGYDLTTSIGPISGSASINQYTSFATDAGALQITDVSGDATFTAVASIGTTPLPAALPLFASGLGALGLLGWRKKRKKVAAAV